MCNKFGNKLGNVFGRFGCGKLVHFVGEIHGSMSPKLVGKECSRVGADGGDKGIRLMGGEGCHDRILDNWAGESKSSAAHELANEIA